MRVKTFWWDKRFALRVNPEGKDLEIDKKNSILETALNGGLAFPHDCKIGACTTCKCRLIEGQVRSASQKASTLSDEEIAAGYILACQSLPESDLVIEVNLLEGEDMHPIKSMEGRMTECNLLTHDIMEVVVTLEYPIQYTSGQYADLEINGVEFPRSYFFATPSEGAPQSRVSFLIKNIPGGTLSGWLFREDRTGFALKVHAPYGFFRLREGTGPIFCIAEGSGLAPLLSILEEAKKKGCARDVVFLYGAETQADFYKLDVVQSIANGWQGEFGFDPVLAAEPEGTDWMGPRGPVTTHIMRQNVDLANAQVYMCGSPEMIDLAESILDNAGMDMNNVFGDRFFDLT